MESKPTQNSCKSQLDITIARMQNILGLHTRMWYDFKDLDGKIATGGFLHPQC